MKKKIFSLLIILTMFFGFAFISLEAQAEYIDSDFVFDNKDVTYNENDLKDLILILNDYAETYELYDNENIADLSNGIGNLLIDFNANLPSLDYVLILTKLHDFFTLELFNYNNDIVFGFGYIKDDDIVSKLRFIDTYDFTLVLSFYEPEPPFNSFINFIKNLLQDLLKNITDMTMHLINNIWDTNLIDINLVVLSDTAIFSGTLNDMLYSVFSIFYVIFAITLVWRLLTKIIKKFTFWERW